MFLTNVASATRVIWMANETHTNWTCIQRHTNSNHYEWCVAHNCPQCIRWCLIACLFCHKQASKDRRPLNDSDFFSLHTLQTFPRVFCSSYGRELFDVFTCRRHRLLALFCFIYSFSKESLIRSKISQNIEQQVHLSSTVTKYFSPPLNVRICSSLSQSVNWLSVRRSTARHYRNLSGWLLSVRAS